MSRCIDIPGLPCRRKSARHAFTLVELLVAITVLALISVVLAQMLSATSQTWITGQARVNNFTKGRAMMDLLTRDLQGGLYRTDLPAFPAGTVGFYTERPGFSSNATTRNLSWVQYDLGASTNTVLQRADLAASWSSSAPPAFGDTVAPAGATPRDTAPGIVGFKVQFIYPDGSISTNYVATNRPRVAAVGLAVVDDKTLELLSANPAKISALRNGFNTNATGTNSIKADWEKYLKNDLNWDAYPKTLTSGLKIFERYVSLP
ncbi:Verru_Chthon cassette protein C [Terrimicrobium sacchariphilum]|uniref:Verru_Chthon cassette protein C n=1 Tax=Terrimicrobium sacchariphilum TaxID=690879 RepID=A0A146G4Y3_TERSA|nr:prepilin-type N-terminal cleavage/methylation domain-containing protein [Terrimicrobium sacchariphilum]GAT31836.1 Verru_Chthon cassette protein C [Terrimicrobium sacchariphilum]